MFNRTYIFNPGPFYIAMLVYPDCKKCWKQMGTCHSYRELHHMAVCFITCHLKIIVIVRIQGSSYDTNPNNAQKSVEVLQNDRSFALFDPPKMSPIPWSLSNFPICWWKLFGDPKVVRKRTYYTKNIPGISYLQNSATRDQFVRTRDS